MARHRLINCEFLCAGSFKVNVSNKGKLLYLMMFMSGDDKGFVDTTQDIINSLENNDKDFTNEVNLSLLENDYKSALNELIDKGYLYEFSDNHENKVHLIRHWFFHNKLVKGLWTNYQKFLEQVELKNNEYIKKPIIKEIKINQDKINEIKLNESETDHIELEHTQDYDSLDDFLKAKGVKSFEELTKEQQEEWNDYIIS